MHIVSTLVFVSQAVRHFAIKAKAKAITAISNRIKKVEAEQVKLEEHRSSKMIGAHKSYYDEHDHIKAEYSKAIDAVNAKYNGKLKKAAAYFDENKRLIALTSQASSNQLKSELVSLRSELDHLTK